MTVMAVTVAMSLRLAKNHNKEPAFRQPEFFLTRVAEMALPELDFRAFSHPILPFLFSERLYSDHEETHTMLSEVV